MVTDHIKAGLLTSEINRWVDTDLLYADKTE